MIFDANVWLGDWPFGRLGISDPRALSDRLKAAGIDRALVSPCEGLFYRNPDEANELLLSRLEGVEELLPAPVVDPSLPGTKEDMTRYAARGVRAFRLLPGYHGYDLDHADTGAFLESFPEHLAILQIRVEDERSQHPLCMVPPVPVERILRLASLYPQRRFLVSGASMAEAGLLGRSAPNTLLELSYAESLNTLARLIEIMSVDRVVFGSHTPLFYPLAAVAKLSDPEVTEDQRARIESSTLRGLLGTG